MGWGDMEKMEELCAKGKEGKGENMEAGKTAE